MWTRRTAAAGTLPGCFPTTIWTTIREAGRNDPQALERFARQYQAAVLRFVRAKGFRGADADDVCQDVFVRLLSGSVLQRATQERGRFRGLLRSVAWHVIQDRWRQRRDVPSEVIDPPASDPDFDREWVLELTERALGRLRAAGSGYYEVLRDHLHGQPQDRNKLWIARGKLIALIKHEVALTCASPSELADELSHLAPYLRPDAVGGNGQ
ncbi:MAG: sigma factor [Planctomycetota bacterium]